MALLPVVMFSCLALCDTLCVLTVSASPSVSFLIARLHRYDNIAGGNPASKGVDNLCRPSLAANPTCAPPKPLISHEMGNYGVFPNLTETIADLNASLNLRTSNSSQNKR